MVDKLSSTLGEGPCARWDLQWGQPAASVDESGRGGMTSKGAGSCSKCSGAGGGEAAGRRKTGKPRVCFCWPMDAAARAPISAVASPGVLPLSLPRAAIQANASLLSFTYPSVPTSFASSAPVH
jgi:hypothetical protein